MLPGKEQLLFDKRQNDWLHASVRPPFDTQVLHSDAANTELFSGPRQSGLHRPVGRHACGLYPSAAVRLAELCAGAKLQPSGVLKDHLAVLEAARQRAAQLRARIASPAQASTSARTTPEPAAPASTVGQPQFSGVLRDYLATRAAAISDSALPQSASAIARPGQGQSPGTAQQAAESAQQAATGMPPQHSEVLRDYLATQRAAAARPSLQGPAASRAQQSRAPDAQAARQEVEQSRGQDAAQGRPQFTGVLGSYMATQAAARSGIGRYGPGNPPLSQASGGWLNLSEFAFRIHSAVSH